MAKHPCPKSFIKVGAASVALRHALFDVDQHYKALALALESAHKDMRENGIARMEISPAELLFAEASTAVLKVMAGHESLRAMCDRHGVETPTDDEILAGIKEMGLKAVPGSHLDEAMTTLNFR